MDPRSAGDTYSSAWAFPESSSCCGKSLQYPTMAMAGTLARFAVLADDAWAREIARRQSLLVGTGNPRSAGTQVSLDAIQWSAALVFNDVRAQNGMIAIRFRHRSAGKAMVQAIEVGPGRNSPGVTPVRFAGAPL